MEALDREAFCVRGLGCHAGREPRCRATGPYRAARVTLLGSFSPRRARYGNRREHPAPSPDVPRVLERARLRVHRPSSQRIERFPATRRRAAVHPGGLMVDRTSPEFKNFLELYEKAPLLELGRMADEVR